MKFIYPLLVFSFIALSCQQCIPLYQPHKGVDGKTYNVTCVSEGDACNTPGYECLARLCVNGKCQTKTCKTTEECVKAFLGSMTCYNNKCLVCKNDGQKAKTSSYFSGDHSYPCCNGLPPVNNYCTSQNVPSGCQVVGGRVVCPNGKKCSGNSGCESEYCNQSSVCAPKPCVSFTDCPGALDCGPDHTCVYCTVCGELYQKGVPCCKSCPKKGNYCGGALGTCSNDISCNKGDSNKDCYCVNGRCEGDECKT